MSGAAAPTIRRHPLVFDDIIAIADYIARDSVDAALRFPDQVDATLRGLAEMPGKGPRCGFARVNMSEVRFYVVDGFPNHLVFYRATPYGIYVLSVRHGARNLPGDLPKRVP